MNFEQKLGLLGISPDPDHVFGVRKKHNEEDSLGVFVETYNLHELVEQYRRNDTDDDLLKNFRLEVKRKKSAASFNGFFYEDGNHTLFLRYIDNKTSYGLATLGYAWTQELKDTKTGLPNNIVTSDEFFLPNAPMIMQLQTIKYDTSNQSIADRYRTMVRWEKMMIHALIDYGIYNGWTRLYLQPSEYSFWYEVKGSDNGKIRYAVTAERMGFERRGPVWELLLPNVNPNTIQL